MEIHACVICLVWFEVLINELGICVMLCLTSQCKPVNITDSPSFCDIDTA